MRTATERRKEGTRAGFAAYAAAMGAVVREDTEGRGYSVAIEAPAGMCWEQGTHEYVSHVHDDSASSRAYARLDLVERTAGGPVKCEDADCDWCGETLACSDNAAP